jgi:rhodanese-related sulfurtransferase
LRNDIYIVFLSMIDELIPNETCKLHIKRRARDLRAESMSMRSMGLTFIYLLLLGFGMTFLTGCGNSQSTEGSVDKGKDTTQNATQPVQGAINIIPATAKLSTNDLDAAMNANKGWQLIDIRESREFATGHIKMALNRPLGDLKNNLAQISKDKDIVLIDLNGTRSESAWQVLVENGYDKSKVKVLTGGMLQWNGIVSEAGSNSGGDNPAETKPAEAKPGAAKPEVQAVVGGC